MRVFRQEELPFDLRKTSEISGIRLLKLIPRRPCRTNGRNWCETNLLEDKFKSRADDFSFYKFCPLDCDLKQELKRKLEANCKLPSLQKIIKKPSLDRTSLIKKYRQMCLLIGAEGFPLRYKV